MLYDENTAIVFNLENMDESVIESVAIAFDGGYVTFDWMLSQKFLYLNVADKLSHAVGASCR